MDIKEKVMKLPLTPGVYLMKDSYGSIIYVGKAKNLKRRVSSYFQNSSSHSQKIVKLKHNIKDFDFILTDTEFEAFMLECSLIKEIKPFFNRKMKNPQGYTFINIDMDEEFPSIHVDNKPSNLHFGPYISKHTVEKAVLGIKEFCKILCTNLSKSNGPCLNVSLGLCIGVCHRESAGKQYRGIINEIISLLNGTDTSILEGMQMKMMQAAEKLDFETAAKYKEYLDAVNFLLYKETVIGFTEENKNIAIIEYLDDQTFKLFLIKRNKILFSEKFQVDSQSTTEIISSIKSTMISYFKTETFPSINEVNKNEIDEAQILYSYLKSGGCSYLFIPDNWLDLNHAVLGEALNELIF